MDGRCVCHTSFSYRAQNNIPSFSTLQSISKTTQNRRLFSSWYCRKSSWSSNVLTIYFHRFVDNLKGAFCWANFHPLRTHYTANVASSFRVTLSTRPNIGCFLLIDRLAPLGHLSRREGKSNFQENSIVKILAWKHGKQIIMNSGRAHLSRRCLRQVTCSSVAQLRKKKVRIAQCPTRLHFLSSSRVPLSPHHTSLSFPFTYAACGRRRRRRKGPSWNIHVLLSSFYPRGAFFLFLPRGGEEVKKERE